MKINVKFIWLSLIGVCALGFILIYRVNLTPNAFSIEVVSPQQADTYQLFYDIGRGFNEVDSISAMLDLSAKTAVVHFFGFPAQEVKTFRIDPGTRPRQVVIKAIKAQHEFHRLGMRIPLYIWTGDALRKDFRPLHNIEALTLTDQGLALTATGDDPYFAFQGEMNDVHAHISGHILRIRVLLFALFAGSAIIMLVVSHLLLRLIQRRAIRLGTLLVFTGIAGFLLVKASYLVYPDIVFTYPFITFDGFQWIHDSLHYLGDDVTISFRNPALPLIIALLKLLGVENLLPLLTVCLLFLFFLFLYRFLSLYFDHAAVLLTVLFLFFNFRLHTFFDYILADQWAITFQLIACYYLAKASAHNRNLILFGVFAAISFLFQYAIGFLSLAFILYWLVELFPKSENRRVLLRYSLISVACGLLIIAPNFIYKWLKFGTPLFSRVTHFQLVKLHFFGLFYYFVNYWAFFGIPVAVIAVYGFFKAFHAKAHIWLLVYTGFFSYFIFWMLLYEWLDVRFLLYLVQFIAFFLAQGIETFTNSYVLRAPNIIPKGILLCVMLPYCFLCGLHDQESPFTSNLLPLTPQNVLEFKQQPVTRWGSNIIINPEHLSMRIITDEVPGFEFLRFSYYQKHRRQFNYTSNLEKLELQQIHEAALKDKGPHYTIRICGSIVNEYFSSMRKKIIFRRDIYQCHEPADFSLYWQHDELASRETVLYKGILYQLIDNNMMERSSDDVSVNSKDF